MCRGGVALEYTVIKKSSTALKVEKNGISFYTLFDTG